MAALIYDFIEVLEKEAEQYANLVEVGNLKRAYIIKGSLKDMGDANTVEGHIVSKVRALEKKRVSLMNDIATVLNINKETVTVTQIEAAMKNQPEEMEALKTAKDKLKKVLNELKIINDENLILINHSIEYTEFSLNMLQSALGEPLAADYGDKPGKIKDSVFDTRQ